VAVGFSNGSVLLLRSEDPTNPTAKNKPPLFLFAPDPYTAVQQQSRDDMPHSTLHTPYVSSLVFGERRLKSTVGLSGVDKPESSHGKKKTQQASNLGKASRLFVTTNGGVSSDIQDTSSSPIRNSTGGASSSSSSGGVEVATDGSVMGSGVVCCFDMTNVMSVSGGGMDGGHSVPLVTLDDDNGCATSCCSHNPIDHQILVARNDAM
jgi:hypothetical protein